MNYKTEDMVPLDYNILVQPLPVKKIRTVQQNMVGGKVNPNTGIKEGGKAETSYEKLPTNMRAGVVLAISDKLLEKEQVVGYKVGDTIVYIEQRVGHMKLDLLAKKADDDKCPLIIPASSILVKIKE